MALLAAPAAAVTISYPECTLPAAELYNIVAAPNIRGTSEILWTCLATIGACTYTVLHPNIPEQRDGRDRSQGWKAWLRGWLKWWWKGILPSLQMMIVTVLAPEIYNFIAISDYLDAKVTLRDLRDLTPDQTPPQGWTLAHAFFANMGGFRVPFQNPPARIMGFRAPDWPGLVVLTGESFTNLLKLQELTPRKYGHPTKMMLSTGDQEDIADEVEQSSSSGQLLRNQGDVPRQDHQAFTTALPTEADIQDRSTSDLFAKLIVLLQLTYFCVNCFTRVGKGLLITPLELGTLGYVACSIISYLALLYKPCGVKTMITLVDPELTRPSPAAKIIESNGPLRRISNCSWSDRLPGLFFDPAKTTALLATVYGAIHVAAWNFAFPTLAERWLWRSCSIASAVAPIVWTIWELTGGLLCFPGREFRLDSSRGSAMVFLGILLILTYIAARIMLMVLMVRGIFYLPSEAFTTTWAKNIPHFG